jgi:hypothetical protein
MQYFLLLSCLLLVGCINQNQADEKMAQGCLAGLKGLLSKHSKQISEVKTQKFVHEKTESDPHRRIIIEAVEKDGWLELDKEFSCLFDQQWGLFKSGHRATLVQIQLDDKIVGLKDGKIHGDFEDFQTLTNSINAAMAQ